MGKHARGARGAAGAVHKECMQRKMHTQVDDEDEDEDENEACLAWHAPQKSDFTPLLAALNPFAEMQHGWLQEKRH